MRVALGAAALSCALMACSGDGNDLESRSVSSAPSDPGTLPPPTGETVAPPDPRAAPPDPGAEAPSDAPHPPAVAPLPPQNGPVLSFDSVRAYEHLRQQVSFGPRPAGSPALARCRQYILDQLKAAGIVAREQAFDAQTPVGPVRMVNVIATLPGRRPDRIALATHYDTKLERAFRFVGASDGASSTAAVLELGRVLASRPREFTVELLFFDGEEAVVEWAGTDNTYGSRYYVQAAQKDGSLAGLKALVLLDMIGDRDLNIRRETNSTDWLVDVIWAAARKLGYGRHFPDEEFAIGGDDHFPFLAAGVPAVDVIDFDYPAWHTAQDDLERVSARSLQVVGETVLAAWTGIEKEAARR